MNRRPTFGLLVDWLEDEYQNNVLSGVEETARKHGANLLCFAGGVLGSPVRFAARRNYVYEFAGAHNVDGLVLLAGTMGNYVGLEHMARYLERYRPLPMVSVGAELPGTPSVLVDNGRGMHALVTHLMQVHGFRRVAFVRGPEASAEAESRYRAYCEVLEGYGLPLDPQLVVPGDFQAESGAAAIQTLMQERRVAFEAVVAASDAMALGAIEALQSRGVRVPYDVSVVGFDDIESARFATAPLTTVRQPLFEQGVQAMNLLLALHRGDPVPPRETLRTQLLVRQSCGCPPQTSLALAQYQLLQPAESLVRTFQYHRARIISDMAQAMRTMAGSLETVWGERLLDALAAEIGGQHRGVFLSTLEEVMTLMSTLGGPVSSWHGALSVLRHHARACAQLDPDAWSAVEELWHEARVLVGLVGERAQGQHRLGTERFDRTLRAMSEELSTCLDTRAMPPILATRLPQLRIKSYFFALFDREQPQELTARLVGTHDAGGRARAITDEAFPAHKLVPSASVLPDRRTTYIVEPVFFEREALGYALFEMGPPDGVLYETLRDQLGGAVMSALLYQRAREGEAGIKNEASRLQTRLLPRDLGVPALRLAAAMLPNGGSGGDYYDIIPTAEGGWIAIGDVAAGHAPPGVFRTILQGVVAATIAVNPSATPSAVLELANRVLFEHLRRRLNSDQDVALLLLHYDRRGQLTFAGAHQDLVVFRQNEDQWTRLPATGPRIGASRDLGHVTDAVVNLEDGDLILLFTDGALQARDARGRTLGVDTLCAELRRARFEPVDHIRDHLVGVVRSFTSELGDDLTLVVGRYGTEEETLSLDEATSPGR